MDVIYSNPSHERGHYLISASGNYGNLDGNDSWNDPLSPQNDDNDEYDEYAENGEQRKQQIRQYIRLNWRDVL